MYGMPYLFCQRFKSARVKPCFRISDAVDIPRAIAQRMELMRSCSFMETARRSCVIGPSTMRDRSELLALLRLFQEVAERAEFGFGFHLLLVALVRVSLGVFGERFDRELHFAAARVHLDDFGVVLGVQRERFS